MKRALVAAALLLAAPALAENVPVLNGISMSAKQEQELRDYVAGDRTKPIEGQVKVGATIPTRIELHILPPSLTTEVPAVRTYRYVMTDAGIAIVNPDNRKVVRLFAAP